MFITVLIPTYRRPDCLLRCLEALKQQTRLANQVLVIVRDNDIDTWTFLQTFQTDSLPLHNLTVYIPGVVSALNCGLDHAQGDIIAITDDDADPHADWLERIEAHFLADSTVGGVGGRDWVYHGTELEDGARKVVGQIQWFGRAIGNHHLGVGKAREVDVLKGVNMSYRRTAIAGLRFDTRMRGTGAQVHFETAFSLTLRRIGWKLIYDPMIAVDHYPAQRFDEDQRNQFNDIAFINAVHNETLALLEYLSPVRRIIFCVWAVLIGTKRAPGFAQVLRRQSLGWQGLLAFWGRWRGWQSYQHYTSADRLPKSFRGESE